MRKFLITLSALALSAGVANAGALVTPAEPIVTAPAPVPMAPRAFDWTGGYAGLGVTYGRASYREAGDLFDFDEIFDDLRGREGDPAFGGFFPSGSGWGGGAFVGFNWQNGNMVYGVEGHLSAHRMRGDTTFAGENGADDLEVRTDVRSMASLRGRLGFSADRTLFFVTAGPAMANVRHNAIGVDSESRNVNGFVVGVGAEHALAGGWNIRGDLEHHRFRSRDFTTAGVPFDGVRTRVNLARVSAVFRF